jgi:hypothetical protein
MLGPQCNGTLHAGPFRLQKVRGDSQARLTLINGSIHTCEIINEREVVLFSQKEAYRRVEHLVLLWQYTPASPPSLLEQEINALRLLSPTRQEFHFCRVKQASAEEFSSWPLFYRRIYSLISTPTSLERLALLSHQSHMQIREAVLFLLRRGFIEQIDTFSSGA